MIPAPYNSFAVTVALMAVYVIGHAEGKAKARGYNLHWSMTAWLWASALLASAAVVR